jgi:hypothetical protein
MRLEGHITLNFNTNMPTAAVVLHIEKAFDTTWHSDLLYKLSELEFSTSLIKLIASFLIEIEFRRRIFYSKKNSGRGSSKFPILYSLHINDASAAPGTHLSLFWDDTCVYATETHERHSLCKLQRGLTAVNSISGRWNIKINEGEFRLLISPESLMTYYN